MGRREKEGDMTLHNFLSTYGDIDAEESFYGGNNCISIDGYCEEVSQEEIMTSDWYAEIKNKKIKRWQTIGGGMYEVEICITLDD